MKKESSTQDIKKIEDVLLSKGLEAHISTGEKTTIIGVVGDTTVIDTRQ
ncbi:MAG: 3-deoxy-7-phosphoheptulonate synthase, partial [Coprobacillaceae bacterium]